MDKADKNKYLNFYKINFGTTKYCTKSWGLASFEAGAQSQQAKIDELQNKLDYHVETNADLARLVLGLQAKISVYEKHVNAIKHIHETQFDENTDTSFILGNLDGFFEYLESDLKGNKDEN